MNKKNILALVLAVFSIYFISGCARIYHVQIDSINDRGSQLGRTYRLLPGNSDTGVNDLQFKEFAGYLVKLLAAQGYTLETTSQPAEMEIYFSYWIGEPEKHTYSYSEPVWGQTGVESYTQTSQYVNKDNSTTQVSNTYVEPQYGVTGYTTMTGEYTAYKKYVILDAYDIKNATNGAKLNEIWKTSIWASGKSSDLRKVMPALLAASAPYVGTNTGQEITVEISSDSEVLKSLNK
jgi:hypothetical protein